MAHRTSETERVVDGRRVVVRRSTRRRRTVSATYENGVVIVRIPAAASRAAEDDWVRSMLRKLETRHETTGGDDALAARAARLSTAHLDSRARPSSIRFVPDQGRRWGSCTPARGTIRLSHRLRGMPDWVVDYVIVHELVHLLESGHTPRFWSLVGRYPHTERARGFLEGYGYAVDVDGAGSDAGAPLGPGPDPVD